MTKKRINPAARIEANKKLWANQPDAHASLTQALLKRDIPANPPRGIQPSASELASIVLAGRLRYEPSEKIAAREAAKGWEIYAARIMAYADPRTPLGLKVPDGQHTSKHRLSVGTLYVCVYSVLVNVGSDEISCSGPMTFDVYQGALTKREINNDIEATRIAVEQNTLMKGLLRVSLGIATTESTVAFVSPAEGLAALGRAALKKMNEGTATVIPIKQEGK